MGVLLDTHVVLWWLKGDNRIPRCIRDIVAHPDTEAFVSAATIWEIAIKSKLGKLPAAAAAVETMPACFTDIGFAMLDINCGACEVRRQLAVYHRDPFDRMLIAQATIESLFLVSGDPVMSHYDVDLEWDALN